MKKGFLCSLLFLLFFSLSAQHSDGSSSGYKITGEITGLGNDTVLLAYYFGGKQYASDTAYCTNGKFIFKGKKSLQGGMYLVVLPGNKYFDIIVSEQQFEIKTDINSLVPSMRFKNSKENTLFYEYLNFITNKQSEVIPLREAEKDASSSEKERIRKEIIIIDQQVKEYQLDFQDQHPDIFFTKIIIRFT